MHIAHCQNVITSRVSIKYVGYLLCNALGRMIRFVLNDPTYICTILAVSNIPIKCFVELKFFSLIQVHCSSTRETGLRGMRIVWAEAEDWLRSRRSDVSGHECWTYRKSKDHRSIGLKSSKRLGQLLKSRTTKSGHKRKTPNQDNKLTFHSKHSLKNNRSADVMYGRPTSE